MLEFGVLNWIYFLLAGIGLVYAVISLIGAEAGHIDLGHIDLDVGGHDLDMGDVHGDFDSGSVSITSLSSISIASFITAFGAFGLIATQLFGVSTLNSLLWAVGGGLVVAAIAHFGFIYIFAPQVSSEVGRRDVVGLTGEVTVPIPADGVGQVALVARGTRVTYSARSADDTPIARGKQVEVLEIVGNTAVVRPRAYK